MDGTEQVTIQMLLLYNLNATFQLSSFIPAVGFGCKDKQNKNNKKCAFADTFVHDSQIPIAMLTGIILWCHRPGHDLSEGVQPLSLLALVLAHEDKLPLGCFHHEAVLPFVPTGVLWDTVPNRVTVAFCAKKDDPQFLSVLDSQ